MKTYDSTGRVVVMKAFYRGSELEGPSDYYSPKGIRTKAIYYCGKCPFKTIYVDRGGKLVRTISDKKIIWVKEWKPAGCG